MVDATISCVRMRDLTRLGRFRLCHGRLAALAQSCASRRQTVTDATSIGDGLSPTPRAASSRPATDDLAASTIWRGMVAARA
jgi:hypothetical protein